METSSSSFSRKRSSEDLFDSEKKNTPRDHGHLGGLLAGKLGSNKFVTDYAVDNRSKCRLAGCKQAIPHCSLRLGKIPPALKSGHAIRTHWYHVECIFKSFERMCKSSKVISKEEDIEGFESLKEDDKNRIRKCIIQTNERGCIGDIKLASYNTTAALATAKALSVTLDDHVQGRSETMRVSTGKAIIPFSRAAAESAIDASIDEASTESSALEHAEAWWLDAAWSKNSLDTASSDDS